MNAIIITIGDEILIGQIVDTNSTFISKQLHAIGIETLKTISIKDEGSQILSNLDAAFKEVDLVIFTGGLGPTNDDITKKVLTEYFEDELVFNDSVMDHIEKLFAKIGRIPSHLNREQAMLPSKARILHNEFGTAAGMMFEKDSKVAISLPGVPFEMKALVQNHVIPVLAEKYHTKKLYYKTLLTYGLPESELAEKIKDWEENLDPKFSLAYLPSPARVRLRLSVKGDDVAELEKAVEIEFDKLNDYIAEYIFGYDDDLIEELVFEKLKENNKTVSFAESFTGGKLASLITSVAGSSQVFKGSVVAYASQAKIDILGVKKSTIHKHSVVSKEVALEMAENSRRLYKSDYSIATTGVAGPDKGEDGKDVGTAIIAVCGEGFQIVEEFNFGQPREKMQGRAIAKAFDMLRKVLE